MNGILSLFTHPHCIYFRRTQKFKYFKTEQQVLLGLNRTVTVCQELPKNSLKCLLLCLTERTIAYMSEMA